MKLKFDKSVSLLRSSGRPLARMASSRKYDLVVYGASGYTGQYVVEEVCMVVYGVWWCMVYAGVWCMVVVYGASGYTGQYVVEEVCWT